MEPGSIAAALERIDHFIAECEARLSRSRRAMDELRRHGIDLPEADATLDEVLVLLAGMKKRRHALLQLLWRGAEAAQRLRPAAARRWTH